MPGEDQIRLQGIVQEALADGRFRLAFPNGHTALGYVAGARRKPGVRLQAGDQVEVALSPYDLGKARILLPE